MALVKDSALKNDCPIKHIAFIMDGNGRWAKRRGMPREFGHKKGAETFKKIMEYCGEVGIKATTFYVFSTENWKRSEKEVSALMRLLDEYLDDCYAQLKRKERDVRFVFLGDKAPFSPSLREKMERIEEDSKNNSIIVNLAINYGGRSELVNAYRTLIKEGKTDICEEDITSALYTKDSPELDMVIRTGGDIRISNFLLWQTAYAELYFTDKLWPDFDTDDLDAAIEVFKSRQRRFGGV
jgi:undecaprenyl diphosphate synthase